MKNNQLLRGALILAVLLIAVFSVAHYAARPKPLWPGSRYTVRDRDQAVERGLGFIGQIASNPEHFSHWGHDLLWCFYSISNTAKSAHLREMARRLGQERARQWQHDHPELVYEDPTDLANFVEGLHSAELLLGRRDEPLQRRIQAAAARYSAVDFLKFDPRLEPPPADIPALCPKCNHQNPRGVTTCEKCRTPLHFRSRYEVWLDALIRTHTGDRYGVTFGASHPETIRWIPAMRPYPSRQELQDDPDKLFDVTYAVTHVVYTLDDYGTYRLSPDWLRPEFNYLQLNLAEAEALNDGEMLGEFLDSLRAFGRDESNPEIRAGVEYLLAHQNPDGSWGDMNDDDVYNRYHATWTAVDGLREYAYRGERRPVEFASAARTFIRANPRFSDFGCGLVALRPGEVTVWLGSFSLSRQV